jgi:RNA polymerase sigma-70 factor (ECF subfamily)
MHLMADGPYSRTSITLLGRLQSNPEDKEAWSEFVQRYGRIIFRWCRHWNLQEADAEDVTQNVLLRLTRKMPQFVYDQSRSFRAWLKTLTHHAWIDFVNSRQNRTQGSGDTETLQILQSVEAREDLEKHLDEAFDRELLDEAITRVRDRVAPNTWEAFRLTAIEGLSGAEAAQRVPMQVAQVFVARRRVQKMLQEEVSKLEMAT